MSTNFYDGRLDDQTDTPETNGSVGPPPIAGAVRVPSRCDRIIALIDACLAQTETAGTDSTTPFDLEIDEVLFGRGGPDLFAGHDQAGQYYLAAQTAHTSTATTWLCAPTSLVALRCILAGRAEARDGFLHSQTGYVITARVDSAGTEITSVQLCAHLSDDLLSCTAEPTPPSG